MAGIRETMHDHPDGVKILFTVLVIAAGCVCKRLYKHVYDWASYDFKPSIVGTVDEDGNPEDNEEEDGLRILGGKFVTKKLEADAIYERNLGEVLFRPQQPLPSINLARCPPGYVAGSLQQAWDMGIKHFLHLGSAAVLLYRNEMGSAAFVSGVVQVLAVLLATYAQIVWGLAFDEGVMPNLFGANVGLEASNGTRPFFTEVVSRGCAAFGFGPKGYRKFCADLKKVMRQGGLPTQEWYAYTVSMVKIEGMWATLAGCVGWCHAEPPTAHKYAELHKWIHILLPLLFLGLGAYGLGNFSYMCTVAAKTDDTYMMCKVAVTKAEKQKTIFKTVWPLYLIIFNAAFLSGTAVSSYYVGPLLTGACFLPVIFAYFRTHGSTEFFRLGWRLVLEYLCVPACFVMPGGDRGHSPLGVILGAVSPRAIYVTQCLYLLLTGALCSCLYAAQGSGANSALPGNLTNSSDWFTIIPPDLTSVQLEDLAYLPQSLFTAYNPGNACVLTPLWERLHYQAAPHCWNMSDVDLVKWLTLVWMMSSLVTVLGVGGLCLFKREYMAGTLFDEDYNQAQMGAADSIEAWADAQHELWPADAAVADPPAAGEATPTELGYLRIFGFTSY